MAQDLKGHLRLKGVGVRYDDHDAVSDVTLDLAPGLLVGLIGANGAGKTSLLRAAAGLAQLATGEVYIGDNVLAECPRDLRARVFGYLAQSRSVLWPLTVARLVTLGRLPHLGPWDKPGPQDLSIVEQALIDADVTHLAARSVTSLSGGELTRVLIARVLAGSPLILLADEPVSGLDPAQRLQVMRIFRKMAHAGRTVAVVMHDLTLAARFCDRLILMAEGRIVADGAPVEVLTPKILSQYYGVTANIMIHENELLVVPWKLEERSTARG